MRAALLPKDEASHGFDNVTVGTLSPTLLDRYITAAQKISQLAVGAPSEKAGRRHLSCAGRRDAGGARRRTADWHPRGALLIRHTFPVDGEYEFQMRLARDRNEEIEGLNGTYELELLIDHDGSSCSR